MKCKIFTAMVQLRVLPREVDRGYKLKWYTYNRYDIALYKAKDCIHIYEV